MFQIRDTALLLMTTLVSFNAFANDTSAGDDNGSIVFLKQANISMEKEKLIISKNKITVDYQFRNHSTQSKRVTMAFPMPAMYFGDSDHHAISDFTLEVNGKHMPTQRRFVVKLDNQDITKALQKLGWNEKALVDLVAFNQLHPLSKAQRQKLQPHWLDTNQNIRFTLHEYFIWQQTFPAQRTVHIRHRYSPSLTSGTPFGAKDVIEAYQRPFCINKPTQTAIQRLGKTNPYHIVDWAELSYILKTGNNWQGAIKDFHLILKKDTPKDIISLCFDGHLKKTSATTFEFRKKNFRPRQDLAIFYASPVNMSE